MMDSYKSTMKAQQSSMRQGGINLFSNVNVMIKENTWRMYMETVRDSQGVVKNLKRVSKTLKHDAQIALVPTYLTHCR